MISLFRNPKSVDRLRGKLAILVPTYRFDSRARHTLAATASLASEEIAVLIGDNSENADKCDFLNKLSKLHSNIHIFCHNKNIGVFSNTRFLFDRATLPHYMFLGDDDFCTPLYVESGIRLLEQHADATAASGPFIMVTSANKMVRGNSSRTEATPYERCTNFPIGGGNSLPASMARRSAIEPFLDYVQGHPLKASFFDWLMSYTLLAKGKYYAEDQGCYLYDASNWENGEACWKNNAKSYVAAGLPESFTSFHELYWAIEFVHFFRGAYSPVTDPQQSMDCARFFYSNRIQEFRRLLDHLGHVRGLEPLISHRPGAADALHALTTNDDAMHPRLFDWFTEVLAAFDPVCALAYADYTRASLDRASTRQTAVAPR